MKSQPNGSVDTYCDANNFLTIFEEVDFVKLIGVKHYSKSVLQKRKNSVEFRRQTKLFLPV